MVTSALIAAFASPKRGTRYLPKNGVVVQSPQGINDCITLPNAEECYTSDDNSGDADYGTTCSGE